MADLFAPPSKEELESLNKKTPASDIYAPPSREELASLGKSDTTNKEEKGPLIDRALGPIVAKVSSYPAGLVKSALSPIAALSEYIRGKENHGLKNVGNTLVGNAPSGDTYLEQTGLPSGPSLSEGLPGLYREKGTPVKDEETVIPGLTFQPPEKGGAMDPTVRGAAGGVIDMLSAYLGGKATGSFLQNKGKNLYQNAPVFQRANAVLDEGSIPTGQMAWESGKTPLSAKGAIGILGEQQKVYEGILNQVKAAMSEAGVTGDIEGAMGKAQNYIDSIGDNRELASVKNLLQKDLDAQVNRLKAVPPTQSKTITKVTPDEVDPFTGGVKKGTTAQETIPGNPGKPAASGNEIQSAKSGVSAQVSEQEMQELGRRGGTVTGYRKAKGAGLKQELEKMAGQTSPKTLEDLQYANPRLSSLYTTADRLRAAGVAEEMIPKVSQLDVLSLADPRLAFLKQGGKFLRKTPAYTVGGRGLYGLGSTSSALAPVSAWEQMTNKGK